MFCLRSVDGRLWSLSFGIDGVDDETPFFRNIFSNPDGKNDGGHYLAGSFSGALSLGTQNYAERTRNTRKSELFVSPNYGASGSFIHFKTNKL